MKERLFHSLRQQLAYELFFVTDVSKVYRDAPNKLDMVDFTYKGASCKLTLNGKIMLETKKGKSDIASFQELVEQLRLSQN